MKLAIGVDIGGTFTDCVAVDEDGTVVQCKVPSTHSTSPEEGVIAGMQGLAKSMGTSVSAFLGDVGEFAHGTTIGTNLVVERRGAKVGLIATAGHADAMLMMRGRGRTAGVPTEDLLNIRKSSKPEPLVPRQRVVEVEERVTRDGNILVPLNEEQARAAIFELLAQDVEAVAVSLLWAFRNPAHERRIREMILAERPDMYVSLSSDIAPRVGEYERTVATVINSYVGPRSSQYLSRLESQLEDNGLRVVPAIMQSNGGVVSVGQAADVPVRTIGSGPVGGLAGTAAIAARAGHRNVIATDMGGTSFEVGLLVDGEPVLASEQVIEQYTFRIPQIDVRSIACGGGSIASVDPVSKGLRVGPESAGSSPGPACYGVGSQPTVTDADVVLGFVDPDRFLNGQMPLNRDASVKAIQRLADDLGMGLEETANGILRVNSFEAATLIRRRTLEQGLDPRSFMVYAFGGAGPVHAYAFASELDVKGVLIPLGNGASTLSAYGIAVSDAKQIFERECSLIEPLDVDALRDVVDGLRVKATGAIVDSGFDRAEVTIERWALMRYVGQFMHEVPVRIPDPIGPNTGGQLRADFEEQYARQFGRTALSTNSPVEIFTVRVLARATRGGSQFDGGRQATTNVAATSERDVFWSNDVQWVRTKIFDETPPPGQAVSGPALFQLPHTTIAVPPGHVLTTDGIGNAVLTKRKEGSA